MTFLELVRRACEESGTVPRAAPDSVVGAQGIVAKWVRWVASAYADIQTAESSWKWLRSEGEGVLFSGQDRFSPVGLGAERFRTWRTADDEGFPLWSLYDPVLGIGDEQTVILENYGRAARYARGEIQTGRPSLLAIDDQMNVFTWPRPDKIYHLVYAYNRAPQMLVNDLDVPEMPEQHHELIIYKALIKNLNFDQAMDQFAYWRAEDRRMMADLRASQLPGYTWGGPLL